MTTRFTCDCLGCSAWRWSTISLLLVTSAALFLLVFVGTPLFVAVAYLR